MTMNTKILKRVKTFKNIAKNEDENYKESEIQNGAGNQYKTGRCSNNLGTEVPLNGIHFSKQTLKLKAPKYGIIATIHHTIRDWDRVLRFSLKSCCFSVSSGQLVSIDENGHVFILDFDRQRHWKHSELIHDVSVLVPSVRKANCYLAGTENGHLVLLNVEKPEVQYVHLSSESIEEISFPSQPKKSSDLALIRTGNEAKLIDLQSLTCIQRLQFNQLKMSLKFANYLPNSEQILTCFMDNSLQIWSSISMEVIRIINPMRIRDKRLENQEIMKNSINKFHESSSSSSSLSSSSSISPKISIISLERDDQQDWKRLSSSSSSSLCCGKSTDKIHGSILSYCYPNDGSLLCFSTDDHYLMLISPYTFELLYLIHLHRFNLLHCALLSKPNDGLIFGLTNDQKLLLFDYHNVNYKLMIDNGPCQSLQLSTNDKLLSIIRESGELKLWSVQYLIKLLRDQQSYIKSLTNINMRKSMLTLVNDTDNFKDHNNLEIELKKLLCRKRLQQILNEYQCFPEKYRILIWCTLLKLPYNYQQYQDLMNMGVPNIIDGKLRKYPLKDQRLRKALRKCWSNLSQWCKIFAYNDTIPQLIFPFVKLFQHNSMIAFEISVTLIQNHFQLFFEYHPLAPNNYLAMCSNILQYFDEKLFNFYTKRGITSIHYAWSILKNCFSEILDEEQWLSLWDNILLAPNYQLIFYVVAYNQLQREIILRLPIDERNDQTNLIEQFFHEQNPIDIRKLHRLAQELSIKCPNALHPRRYIDSFHEIPSGVYPKFLRYPINKLENFENKLDELESMRNEIVIRMHELEMDEKKILQRLSSGLQREEHNKRMKNLEDHYQKILKQEEERLNCQRKILLLYRKEIRHRKQETIQIINESKDRKDLLRYEREFQKLKHLIECERLQNDTHLLDAKELLNDEKMKLKTMKSEEMQHSNYPNLSIKYSEEMNKILSQYNLMRNDLKRLNSYTIEKVGEESGKQEKCSNKYLDLVERTLNDLENEWIKITKEDNA